MENISHSAEHLAAEEYHREIMRSISDSGSCSVSLFRPLRDENNVSVDFEYVLVNEAAKSRLGGIDPIGERYTAVKHEIGEKIFHVLKQVDETGLSQETEYIYQQNGAENWRYVRADKINNLLVLTLKDITETRQPEAAPGLLNDRSLLDELPSMIQVFDLGSLKTVYCNRRYSEVFGSTRHPDGTWPLLLSAFTHEEDLAVKAAFEQQLRKAKDGELVHAELRLIHGSGVKWFCLKGKVYRRNSKGQASMVLLIAEETAGGIQTESRKQQQDKKTINFLFGNISHEFRTPITLLRGALDDLHEHVQQLPDSAKQDLEGALRNTLRLQKMVNTLLDFSRLETGMDKLCFRPVDVVTLTGDLANSFRSAIERSGLTLDLDIEAIDEPAYVEKDMWEKIVLNLLSNAFKYTYQGGVRVSLRRKARMLELNVEDTGIGIPSAEIKKIFERFYRVSHKQVHAREGTGIGLSLVKELVRIHKGSVAVKSRVGKGSVFTVSIPLGKEHLPPEQVKETFAIPLSEMKDTYVAEALNWVPGSHLEDVINDLEDPRTQEKNVSSKPCVLLVENNPDMRDYLRRMLGAHYRVVLAGSNSSALHHITQFYPDLVLCDTIHPELDGKELLHFMKSNRETMHIPVIIMSSKAADETRIDCINHGADDYVIKPFSAKELLSRVGLTIRIARTRRNSERNLRNIILQAPVGIMVLQGPDHVVEEVNDNILQMIDARRENFKGKPFFQLLPYLKPHMDSILNNVLRTGTPYTENEMMLEIRRYGKTEKCFFSVAFHPMKEEDNSITGIMAVVNEITQQVRSRQEIEESEKRFKMVADTAPVMIWMAAPDASCIFLNKAWSEFTGLTHAEGLGGGWGTCVHPEDIDLAASTFRNAVAQRGEYNLQFRLRRADGEYRWIYDHAVPRFSDEGEFLGYIGSAIDIHEQKAAKEELENKVAKRTLQLFKANMELKQSNQELEQFAYVASHDLQEPLRKIRTYAQLLNSSLTAADEQIQTYLGKINDSSARMSHLIKDVLNYSKLARQDELFEDVNLNRIIENIKTDFELLIEEKKVMLHYEPLPVIKGIPLQLHQLFTNLLGNSIKFCSVEPEVRITCSVLTTAELLAHSTLARDKIYWKITVSDNGIGFEQEYAEKIFTIFHRLNAKVQYEGTGIGLALCKKIVNNHKGSIYAKGAPGQGAEFTIILPA